jgi:signal transduction histidine kinase
MSDIVWSINPAKDHFSDLTQRMRRFAADVLAAKGIGLGFSAPHRDDQISLNSNIRREVFLIFKESVNNVVRHSGATRAQIEVGIADGLLRLTISDNGRGFDPESDPFATDGGNGIPNISQRAAAMNGRLAIDSGPGSGTRIVLEIPIGPHKSASV